MIMAQRQLNSKPARKRKHRRTELEWEQCYAARWINGDLVNAPCGLVSRFIWKQGSVFIQYKNGGASK